jgi:hypothetical protein
VYGLKGRRGLEELGRRFFSLQKFGNINEKTVFGGGAYSF